MKTLYICSTLEQAQVKSSVNNLYYTQKKQIVSEAKQSIVYYGTDDITELHWLYDNIVDDTSISGRIHQWADEKGILEKATPLTQWDKTLEEVMELKEALVAQANGLEFFINSKGEKVNTYNAILDALGDVRVTIDIQCKMQKTSLDYCSELAYNVISKRTGKMINGQFVKDE